MTYLLITHNVWPEGPQIINTLTLNYTIDMMMGELYVMTFVTAIKITLDLLQEQKRVTDLEKSQLETELLFLKSQISPHFFFNTLNNIYSLSVEKSNKTPKIVLKLSELMRYMIYETNDSIVPISKELAYLESYIDLQKIRFGDDIQIDFKHELGPKSSQIEPMLLIPFVENAFKHGVGFIENPTIEIELKDSAKELYFKVANKMD